MSLNLSIVESAYSLVAQLANVTPVDQTLIPKIPDFLKIVLPEKFSHLDQSIFPLHRSLESVYRNLPWPVQIQNVTVMTEVYGGLGDISAAAKVIGVMQRICPTLRFDWVLDGDVNFAPDHFLSSIDRSRIHIRELGTETTDIYPSNLFISGPVALSHTWFLKNSEWLERKIKGPILSFIENGWSPSHDEWINFRSVAGDSRPFFLWPDLEKAYRILHGFLFPSEYDKNNSKKFLANGQIPMGLQSGSGIFLDRSRFEAPLSRDSCCPTYLLQIQDHYLRSAILESMGVDDGRSLPDYDRYSLNSGYAHHAVSWGKFIDCVAAHETDKHVVIVLNRKGAIKDLSIREFRDRIFTSERLKYLQQKGYGKIYLRDDEETFAFSDQNGSRQLTVIARRSFLPNDMKNLQLAAERHLATGDNSAAEAFAARSKLYLYECVEGFKQTFFQQQVEIAHDISPALAEILTLFGGDHRQSGRCYNQPLDIEQKIRMEKMLKNPDLPIATMQFCKRIIEQYSFEPVLEGAIKRAVWHYLVPGLAEIEADALDSEFRSSIVSYVNLEAAKGFVGFLNRLFYKQQNVLPVRMLPELTRRIHEAIHVIDPNFG